MILRNLCFKIYKFIKKVFLNFGKLKKLKHTKICKVFYDLPFIIFNFYFII